MCLLDEQNSAIAAIDAPPVCELTFDGMRVAFQTTSCFSYWLESATDRPSPPAHPPTQVRMGRGCGAVGWTGIAPIKHNRESLRYPSDLTDHECALTAEQRCPYRRASVAFRQIRRNLPARRWRSQRSTGLDRSVSELLQFRQAAFRPGRQGAGSDIFFDNLPMMTAARVWLPPIHVQANRATCIQGWALLRRQFIIIIFIRNLDFPVL